MSAKVLYAAAAANTAKILLTYVWEITRTDSMQLQPKNYTALQ
jgi:hypothetical protein